MGYVPPTLEEWNDPRLIEDKIRRQTLMTGIILVFGLVGFLAIFILAAFRLLGDR